MKASSTIHCRTIPPLLLTILLILWISPCQLWSQPVHLRFNQLGYLPGEPINIHVLAQSALLIRDLEVQKPGTTENLPFELNQKKAGLWGKFSFQYELKIDARTAGDQLIVICKKEILDTLTINATLYHQDLSTLLAFMRQQRCGYNPYFGDVCHQSDGRLFYGPVPDSTYYDFSGGYHDAADQLKYLITCSNATARMLMAFQEAGAYFGDQVDALGHHFANGVPDILDEARWGLEWILKLHPHKDWLIHQVADDRDHRGFKIPSQDNAEYGWGKNSYRAAYFANGKPQGLGKYQSEATGVANLAGRCAAALAMASTIWQETGLDTLFALRCRQAAIELYALGRKQEGYQQGNSFGAPYRYNEDSWEDDMEWGASELYKITGNKTYLEDAMHYARLIRDDGWMARDSMKHYQKYPFMNMGHYSLFEIAPDTFKERLVEYYRLNLEKVASRAGTNAYGVGVPFLWCSNNLTVNLITQVVLYERMTGDERYHEMMLKHRDWLFGRNPWGTTMFTGIPQGGEYPEDVHLVPTVLLNTTPPGGLVDGPLYKSAFRNIFGLTLQDPDEFETFQNEFVIYHDDIGDFSTNEPTMDGTADAIFLWTLFL